MNSAEEAKQFWMRSHGWTTEPPNEPGYYWWRNLTDLGKRVMHVPFVGPDMICGSAGQVYGHASLIGGEWWPIRIPEPEQ